MGAFRRSRTIRAGEPVPLKIQERDEWILESLAKMTFLTTAQLGALYFGASSAATNKRMGKLHRAGYVRAWVPHGNLAAENVYSLDRKGAGVIAKVAGQRPRVPQGLDGQLRHRLLINEVRVRLAMALAEDDGEITSWQSDQE